jgi:hypothetical protein
MFLPTNLTIAIGLLSFINPIYAFLESDVSTEPDILVVQDAPQVESDTHSTWFANSSIPHYGFDSLPNVKIPIDGYTKQAKITAEGAEWSVYEDMKSRDGNIIFQTASGDQRVFHKYTEPSFWVPNSKYPKFLGKSMRDIGMALRDILADELLKDGEPIEEKVAAIIPPSGLYRVSNNNAAASWTSFVGNVHAIDTMPVFSYGSTRTYRPKQFVHVNETASRHDGNVGGWLPAVRKINPVTPSAALNPSAYDEFIIFGEVDSKDPFMVQHWVRTARIEDGKFSKVVWVFEKPEQKF